MTLKEYVKIAVGLREHPKILQAGDDAGWMYVCAIMWSKEHDTDGFIPEYALSRLTGLKRPRLVLAKLLQANLFEVAENGWRIHDYSDVQESSERRKAAAKRAANARWAAEKGMRSASEPHADRNANALRRRNAEKEEEKEEELPPSPPRGNRTRDRKSFEEKALAWSAAAGVTGPASSVVRAYGQAGAWNHPDPAEHFRGFCREHFTTLTITEEPMAEVRPLPERDAA